MPEPSRGDPSGTTRRLIATSVLLGLLGLVARLSWGAPAQLAALRLSWSTEGQRVKQAVAADPNRPAHMQLPEGNYEFRLLPYRLVVKLDGSVRLDRLVTPRGVRQDRPLMVLEEFAATPGEHSLEVEFTPAVATDEPPRIFRLSATRQFQPGRVLLVTLGADDRLILRP